jgi:hypothetical protein
MSLNLLNADVAVGLTSPSSDQHCLIRSTSLGSIISSSIPLPVGPSGPTAADVNVCRFCGIRGRNGGVSPLRRRPIISARHIKLWYVIAGNFSVNKT